MSNSDSEDADFESADEDFSDEETVTKKQLNSNFTKTNTFEQKCDIKSSENTKHTSQTENLKTNNIHTSDNQVIIKESEKDKTVKESISEINDTKPSNIEVITSLNNSEPKSCQNNEVPLSKPQNGNHSSYGWGSWGQSFMSTNWSSSMSTLANQLGEGLNTVVQTVESTLDVPPPEEMAERNTKKASQSSYQDTSIDDDENRSSNSQTQSTSKPETKSPLSNNSGWFSGWGVSGLATGLSSTVQKTGTSIVYGGIDVLETIGKKTMDVLHETDPGLTKTKALLRPGSNKPNLSQILREAESNQIPDADGWSDLGDSQTDYNFGALLEKEKALAHLEALEMLSKSCDTRLHTRLASMSTSIIATHKPRLAKLEETLASVVIDETMDEGTPPIPVLSDEEMNDKIEEYWRQTKLGVLERVGQCRLKNRQLTCEAKESTSAIDIHRLCLKNLAYLTARLIESFHKAGEIIVAKSKSISNWQDLAMNLVEVVRLSCADNETMCSEYIALLKQLLKDGNRQEINKCITNIYLELGNSKSYIQDSFQLLIPAMKFASIET